jgi:hypothetical protein
MQSIISAYSNLLIIINIFFIETMFTILIFTTKETMRKNFLDEQMALELQEILFERKYVVLHH